ncbi:MAG: four helix bundle suffix domain-containing protein [Candidatus Omnitrophica bacterium]|nr:four helix bundle suffix domain-containing protein [Candidatus Omnitrophota bacterium]
MRARTNTDDHGQPQTNPSAQVRVSPCRSVIARDRPCVPTSAHLVANAALSLLNLGCHMLDRQIAAQGKAFVEEGGFTERLYRSHGQWRRRGC